MAPRRSERIKELKKRQNQPTASFVPSRPRRSEELREEENEELKETLKKTKETLTTTQNRLQVEQRYVRILERKVATIDDRISFKNMLFREMKIRLEASSNAIKNQIQELVEMEGLAEECKNHDNVKEAVEAEARNTEKYRDGLLEGAKKHQEGGPYPWRVCEHCTGEFGEEEGAVPRILNCGHTFCTNCVKRFTNVNEIVRCPLDRQFMARKDGLPKNFALLSI